MAYLKKKGFPDIGSRVEISADKVPNPARMDNFQIRVVPSVELSDDHKAGMEQAVHHCLIHNTLLHPPSISLTIEQPALEPA